MIVNIKLNFTVHLPVYRVRKIRWQLQCEQVEVARYMVARLMRADSLAGSARPRRAVRCTLRDPVAPGPLDRIRRQFSAERPNQL